MKKKSSLVRLGPRFKLYRNKQIKLLKNRYNKKNIKNLGASEKSKLLRGKIQKQKGSDCLFFPCSFKPKRKNSMII